MYFRLTYNSGRSVRQVDMDQTLDKSPYKVGDKVWVKISSNDPQTLPSNNMTAAMQNLWFNQGQGQTEGDAYLDYVRENNDLKASFKKEQDDEEQRLLCLPSLKLRSLDSGVDSGVDSGLDSALDSALDSGLDPGLDCSLQAMPPTPPQAKEQSDSDPLIIFMTGDDKSPPEVVTLTSQSSPRTDSLGEVLAPELAQSKNLPSSQQSSKSPGLVPSEVTKLSTPSQLSRSVVPLAKDIAPVNIFSEHLEPATDLTLQISLSVLPPAKDIAPINIISEHLGPATDHTLQISSSVLPPAKDQTHLHPISGAVYPDQLNVMAPELPSSDFSPTLAEAVSQSDQSPTSQQQNIRFVIIFAYSDIFSQLLCIPEINFIPILQISWKTCHSYGYQVQYLPHHYGGGNYVQC